MTESTTISLTEQLRAKLASVPATDEYRDALLALTDGEMLTRLRSIQFEPSAELDAQLKALHDTAPEDIPRYQLIQVVRALYTELLAHLPSWHQGWDRWALRMLSDADEALAQCVAMKGRLARLREDEQAYYWNAIAGLRELNTYLFPLIEVQINQFNSVVLSLLGMLECDQTVPQMFSLADSSFRRSLDALSQVSEMLDNQVYGLERDHCAALLSLHAVAPTPNGSSADDEDDSTETSAGPGRLATAYDDSWSETPYAVPAPYPDVNPATGLPMIGNSFMDVGGHIFGTGLPGDS